MVEEERVCVCIIIICSVGLRGWKNAAAIQYPADFLAVPRSSGLMGSARSPS